MAESGSEFEAQVRLEFENLEEMAGRLSSAIGSGVDMGVKGTKKLVERFVDIGDKVQDIGNELRNASETTDFRGAREGMTFLAREATRVATQISRLQGVSGVDAGQIKAAAREMAVFARITEQANQKVIKTSLASQNVVRIIQDAPFGMFGIANNIEQMAESIGRLRQETGSFGGAFKAAFMPLITGPMAIPFVVSLITALTLSWDKLALQLDKVRVKLGLITEAQAEFNAEMAKLEASGVKDAIGSIAEEDVAFFIERMEDALVDAEERLMEANKQFKETYGFTIAQAKRASEEVAEAQRAAGSGSVIGGGSFFVDAATQEMADAYERGTANIKQAQENLSMVEDGLDRLLKRDQLILKEQQIRQLLGLETFESEAESPKQSRRGKDIEPLERAAIQLRIDAMQDGLAKTVAQIRLNGMREREEMIENYGERADLIELLEAKEAALIQAAMEDNAEDVLQEARKAHEERMKFEEEARKELLDARMEAIKTGGRIGMFNIQGRAFESIANSDPNNPFAAGIQQAQIEAEAKLAEIEVRRREIGALLDAEMMDKAEANAELRALSNEELAIRRQTADEIKSIESDKRRAIAQTNVATLDSMADFFGSLNVLSATEGEKGLEQTKKFLFAQASMQAIAAGISAYESIMAMKGLPFPVKLGYAVAQSVAITARLMAAAKRIKQIGKEGGSASAGISGGFVQLNNAVTGQRISNFERQRGLQQSRGDDGVVEAINDLGSRVDMVGAKIQNQRVTYDDRTAGEMVQKGTKLNRRLTGNPTAGA